MQNSQQAIADSATKSKQAEINMSLDSSRPGGSRLDELVPSRYALKVGEIDAMVVSDGVLSLPGAMLANHLHLSKSDRMFGHTRNDRQL